MKTFEFSIIASGLDPTRRTSPTGFSTPAATMRRSRFRRGRIVADFAREADSVDTAICSAVACVKKAAAQVDWIENV